MLKFINTVGLITGGIAMMMQIAHPVYAQSTENGLSEKPATIPRCSKKIGTVSIVEPENKWWSTMGAGLGSPEALIRIFILQSECFTLVSTNLAPNAVQPSSTLQNDGTEHIDVKDKPAEYFIIPDIVGNNGGSGGGSGGNGVSKILTRTLLFGAVGLVGSSFNNKKSSRNVILYLKDAQTSEEIAAIEGHALKSDLTGAESGDLFTSGVLVAGGASGYAKTKPGKVLALAYLRAFTQMVNELGALPSGK